jgi:NAD(P)-dependent dehydrogenase (short-subunit alcohol dehydrogenase family)
MTAGRDQRGEVLAQTSAQFDLTDKTAVVTGGSGALGGAIAQGLLGAGARVAIIGRDPEKLEAASKVLEETAPGRVLALSADVTKKESLLAARTSVLDRWGSLGILVNAAGGNVAGATLAPGEDFFGLDTTSFEDVLALNLLGTLLPISVFGSAIREGRAGGSIINVSSMAATRVITRVVAYSSAKAAVENLTRWLAVEFARAHRPPIRVNAIAPGFFLGAQNRSLLLAPDGGLTSRGEAIVAHTPMGRFGSAAELIGVSVWLASEASSFVTGAVVPVDGGFSAFSGV